MVAPLWTPTPQRIADANITAFSGARRGAPPRRVARLRRTCGAGRASEPEAFWREVWDDAGVIGHRGTRVLVDGDRMPGARFFPDATLNFAREPARAASARRRRRRARVPRRGQGPRSACRTPRCTTRCRGSRRRCDAAGVRHRRSRRGDRAQHARGDRSAMLAALGARRDLVVVLAGLRRAGRARPLRPDRADGALRRRRLLRTTARRSRLASKVADDRRQRCRPSSASSSFRTSRRAGPGDLSRIARRGARGTTFLAPHAPRAIDFVAAAVRPSALHPVLVGHDRRAQVHRARRRRHAAAAPEGASPARRPEAAATGSSTSRPAAG